MTAPPAAAAAPLARGAAGALLGAAAGTVAWGLAAPALGWETGAFAIPAGALAGWGSKAAGGRGTAAAAAAALLALLAAFLGQGWASRGRSERDLRRDLEALDRKRYDEFAEAAAEWGPKVRGPEIAKFAYRHGFVSMERAGVAAQLEAFGRDVVPALEAWRKAPPPFERWQEGRREALRRGFSPWGRYLRAPLEFVSPLDLLCWLLGAAAAARLAWVSPPPRAFRRHGAPPPGSDPPAPRS